MIGNHSLMQFYLAASLGRALTRAAGAERDQ
jgi:hypothetical protein